MYSISLLGKGEEEEENFTVPVSFRPPRDISLNLSRSEKYAATWGTRRKLYNFIRLSKDPTVHFFKRLKHS